MKWQSLMNNATILQTGVVVDSLEVQIQYFFFGWSHWIVLEKTNFIVGLFGFSSAEMRWLCQYYSCKLFSD